MPVVFLHGWGLGHKSYRQPIARLVDMGCQVIAPALPGFGGTAQLPRRDFSIQGYAAWVDRFLSAIGVDEPVMLVGHSFGGGVAIATAHAYGDRVRSLVLVNSIGGERWKRGQREISMAERPILHWGLSFPADIFPLTDAIRMLPGIVEEALPNLVKSPTALWKVGMLARSADLAEELDDLRDRRLPVLILWGARDGVIPHESFRSLCERLGRDGEVVDGAHGWLLADPDAFGDRVAAAVESTMRDRGRSNHPASRPA